jgi:hypothetical protein
MWETKAYQLPPLVRLTDETGSGSWPTPTGVTDTGGAALCKWGGAGSRAKLRTMVSPEELNGALNPTWVEWLMGFPLGWTVCNPSATPSSRKSPKSSGGQS